MDKYKIQEEGKQRKTNLASFIVNEYKSKLGGGVLDSTKKNKLEEILKNALVEADKKRE